MMFQPLFTSSLLFSTLLCASIGSTNGLCMPCQSKFSNAWYPGLPRRSVYNPKITDPTAQTTWKVGSQVTVTWDTYDMPKDVTNAKATIFLGHVKPGSQNEHLNTKHPLVDNFDTSRGTVSFKVPQVTPGDGYIVVLLGDSGNRSPTFRIEGP